MICVVSRFRDRMDPPINNSDPDVEPVQLQVVCRRLWEHPRLDKAKITLDDVARSGDVDQALAMFYENAVHAAAMAAGITESQIREWCEQKLITSLQTRGMVLREYYTTGGLSNVAVDESRTSTSDSRRGKSRCSLV